MEELDKLREEIRQFKIRTGLSYAFLSKKIFMRKESFYNFMCGTKGLSEEKKKLVLEQMRRFE